MPINVKIADNTHTVKVKTNSSDLVKTRDDCKVEKSRLDALISQERQERIAADELLQDEINSIQTDIDDKQDKIQFVEVYNPSGVIPASLLNYLVDNLVNRLVFCDTIYYLGSKEGNIQKYFTDDLSGYTEIDLNIQTGEYVLLKTTNPTVEDDPDSDDLILTFN